MVPRSPITLLAPSLLATRPRLLRPIEPRLAARLDAIVAIPQPQSSPDSRPATNAVLSEQLQPAHHRPPRRSSSRPESRQLLLFGKVPSASLAIGRGAVRRQRLALTARRAGRHATRPSGRTTRPAGELSARDHLNLLVSPVHSERADLT